MFQEETVKALSEIGTPKSFEKGEYICYEGQQGREMYVILKGSVGVYLANLLGEQNEVSRIMPGDFFGEMAVFDYLPRSASCVALEDTLCIAIGRDRLSDFILTCPELAVRIVENLSKRIRKMDNLLCKTVNSVINKGVPEFSVPKEYEYSHYIAEPECDADFLAETEAECPICYGNMFVTNVKRGDMTLKRIKIDARARYKECDPLWYDIWTCPHCHYSNHYLSFFKMVPFKRDQIIRILEQQQKPELDKLSDFKTPFDLLFLRYLQAIHINMSVNSDDIYLIGHLWRSLYWLFDDAGDAKMSDYCRTEALKYLSKALEDNKIGDSSARQSTALFAANMYSAVNDRENALKMCEIAINGENAQIEAIALRLKDRI